jgi:tetratricopeptide (TPR) repeat protein
MRISVLLEKWWFQYAALAFLLTIVYANTLSNEYVLDDKVVFTENVYVMKGISGFEDILRYDSYKGYIAANKKALIKPGHYTPISLLTFALEEEYFKSDPYVSHLVNLVLFILASWLVLALCRTLFGRVAEEKEAALLAFVAALVFALHPLQTEVVNHIKNRDAVLAMIFGTTSAIVVLLSVGRHWVIKVLATLPAALFLLLALMSKETAYAFVLIIPLMIWAFAHSRKRDYPIVVLPLSAAAYFYFKWMQSFLTLEPNPAIKSNIIYNPFADAPLLKDQIATMFFVWLKYLQKLAVPFPLTHDYTYSVVTAKSFSDLSVIGSILLVVVVILVSLTILRKHAKIFTFALISLVISLLTVSHVLFPLDRIMAESYIQIALLPFSIGIAYMFYDIAKKFNRNISFVDFQPVFYAMVVVFVAYAIVSFSRNPQWKDNLTLHMADVKTSPSSARLRDALGDLLATEAKKVKNDVPKKKEILNMSIKHLKKALEIYPEFTSAWVSLGDIYAELGMLTEAREHYQKALNFDKTHAEAHHSLAKICMETSDYRGAVKCFISWISADAANKHHVSEAFYGIGQAYEKMHKLDSAAFAYNAAIMYDSTFSDAYNRLGVTEGKRKGSMHVSIAYFNKAIEFNKRNIEAYFNLGEAYAKKGDFDRAIACYEKILIYQPRNGLAYFEISKMYLHKKNTQKAQLYLNKAIELEPELRSKIKYRNWFNISEKGS